MKILNNYEDLVGKTIAFSHMAQFAEHITIATEDGCVLMATTEYAGDFERKETRVLSKHSVINLLDNDDWMREELSELGIFDMGQYKEQQRIKREKELEEYRKQQKERDRKTYERLKLIFEG